MSLSSPQLLFSCTIQMLGSLQNPVLSTAGLLCTLLAWAHQVPYSSLTRAAGIRTSNQMSCAMRLLLLADASQPGNCFVAPRMC